MNVSSQRGLKRMNGKKKADKEYEKYRIEQDKNYVL